MVVGLVRKDKVKKVVRKFPRKEIEIERALYAEVHPRVTLNHPRAQRIIKDSIFMDPTLLNLALEHTLLNSNQKC